MDASASGANSFTSASDSPRQLFLSVVPPPPCSPPCLAATCVPLSASGTRRSATSHSIRGGIWLAGTSVKLTSLLRRLGRRHAVLPPLRRRAARSARPPGPPPTESLLSRFRRRAPGVPTQSSGTGHRAPPGRAMATQSAYSRTGLRRVGGRTAAPSLACLTSAGGSVRGLCGG